MFVCNGTVGPEGAACSVPTPGHTRAAVPRAKQDTGRQLSNVLASGRAWGFGGGVAVVVSN